MPRKVSIFDCTLRDGSYAVNFQHTAADTEAIVRGIDQLGIEWIEVGHGLGLNASGPRYGQAAATDAEYVRAASRAAKHARIGAFFIPGIAAETHVDLALDCGATFLRIGTNIVQSEESWRFIRYAKQKGLYVFYNAMKSYVVSPQEFLRRAIQVVEQGADSVYVVDSTGNMAPGEVGRFCDLLREGLAVPFGFHGHNNLGLAIANSFEALEHGASTVDCTLAGIGRGGGNAQLEVFVALCERLHIHTGVDLLAAQDAARSLIHDGLQDVACIEEMNTVMGFAGFHSSFVSHLKAVAEKCRVDPRRLIIEVSKYDRVAPTRELMEMVAGNLLRRYSTTHAATS
ncbi:MAG: 4-hydroxy-2-oxovalerate aldolase [Planctomycetota bacterium]